MNPQEQNQKQETNFGPTIGIVLIIVLMVFGAIYYMINEAQNLSAREKAYDEAKAATSTTEIIYATTTEATTTP